MLLERERVDLVKSELQKNTSIKSRGFVDEVSPWAGMNGIEVPGEGLEIALTSRTAREKICSVPFQETKCLVQKVPPFKHFVFINRNVVAADSKILRFRRFEDFPTKSASQRASEERTRRECYDLIIKPKNHQRAIVLAENYATLYRHFPEILNALRCTEDAVSEPAKQAFERVFESKGYHLQNLIDCRYGTFDVADFLEKEGVDHREVSDHKEITPVPSKDLESFSTYWTLSCPFCSRFECGCHESGENVSLVTHSSVLSRQRLPATTELDLIQTELPCCSDKCYRSKEFSKMVSYPYEAG